MKAKSQVIVGNNAKCPFGVSILDILLVDDVHLCLHELLTFTYVKVSHLKLKKVKLNEKFIDLWFNMDDRKTVVIEAHDDMVLIESDMKTIEQNIHH
jgi:hypothetical protein